MSRPFEGGFEGTSEIFMVMYCSLSYLTYSIRPLFSAYANFEDAITYFHFNLGRIETYDPRASKIEL